MSSNTFLDVKISKTTKRFSGKDEVFTIGLGYQERLKKQLSIVSINRSNVFIQFSDLFNNFSIEKKELR